MRYSERFSNKINDLLIINDEVEKIYLVAFKNVDDEELKVFFKEHQLKSYEFSKELRDEIFRHNIVPRSVNVLNIYYKNQMDIQNNDSLKSQNNILIEVFNLIKVNIDAYNELLMEISLPLSLCKILVKQRDSIQSTMRVFERNNIFIA